MIHEYESFYYFIIVILTGFKTLLLKVYPFSIFCAKGRCHTLRTLYVA